MREYKFRAWHEGYPASVDPQMIYDSTPGDCLKWKAEGQKIAAIMQWTGLTDRNGKEIYEGDIIEVSRYDNDERYVTKIDDIRRIPNILYGSAVNWREVMGNQFENPELINS